MSSSTTGTTGTTDAAAKKEPVNKTTIVSQKKDLEEEEFEEFQIEDWPVHTDDDDVNVWEDNWDDETHESEFSKQLKEELAKSGHQIA